MHGLLLAVCAFSSPLDAAEFSWNSSTAGADWSVPGNWSIVSGVDVDGVPDADDNIVDPTLNGVLGVNVGSATVANWTLTTGSQDVIGDNGSVDPADLNITGTLTKSGTGTLGFRRSNGPLHVTAGALSLTGGTLTVGNSATADASTFTITGAATVSNATLQLIPGGQAGTIGGTLTLSGTGRLHLVAHGQGGTAAAGEVHAGGLGSADSTTLVTNNGNSGTGHVGTLVLNNTSGVTTYAGQIADGSNTGADNVLHIEKNNAGTQVFSGASAYIGTTTINGGALLVNGTHTTTVHTADTAGDPGDPGANPATAHLDANGGGAYVVNSGGTLGGSGSITTALGAAVTVAGGASLKGGAGAVGQSLTLSGDLDLLDGSVIQLVLGASGTHSSLVRSAGTWTFDSNQAFLFTDLGAAAGTYDNIISGLTGSETGLAGIASWTIQNTNWAGVFSYDGSGSVDLEVTVIPEPAPIALLALGAMVIVRRRRSTLA